MTILLDDQRAAQRILDHNEVFTFGKFEGAIAHFHRTLRAALAGRAPAA